jgi:hypothetical protein
MNQNQIQQGDILLEKIDLLPTDAKLVKRTQHGVIIAESRVTNNRHFIPDRGVNLFRRPDGEQFVVNENKADAELKHSASDGAHHSLSVAPGVHRVSVVTEMDHIAQMKHPVED